MWHVPGNPATWKYEVFISHAGPDKEFGEELHKELKGLGLIAFLDQVRRISVLLYCDVSLVYMHLQNELSSRKLQVLGLSTPHGMSIVSATLSSRQDTLQDFGMGSNAQGNANKTGSKEEEKAALPPSLTLVTNYLNAVSDMQLELLPGGAADEAMLDAANKAPVGIAVFSPEYFARKWPMRELEILVRRQVMLPVVFRFDSHEAFVNSLRSSAQQRLVQGDWETFTKSVERTTYLKRKEEYTSGLRQVIS